MALWGAIAFFGFIGFLTQAVLDYRAKREDEKETEND